MSLQIGLYCKYIRWNLTITNPAYYELFAITNPAYYELFAITNQKAGPLEHSLQTEPWLLRRSLAFANISLLRTLLITNFSLLRTLLITNFSPLRTRKLVPWNIPCKQSPGCYEEVSLLRTSRYYEPCLLRTFRYYEPCLLRTFRHYEPESRSLGIFPANRALAVTKKSRFCEHLAITNPAYYELFAITNPAYYELFAITNPAYYELFAITNQKAGPLEYSLQTEPWLLRRSLAFANISLLRTFHFFELRGWSQQNTSCITNPGYNEFPLLRTCLSLQLVKTRFHRTLKAKMFLEKNTCIVFKIT